LRKKKEKKEERKKAVSESLYFDQISLTLMILVLKRRKALIILNWLG